MSYSHSKKFYFARKYGLGAFTGNQNICFVDQAELKKQMEIEGQERLRIIYKTRKIIEVKKETENGK